MSGGYLGALVLGKQVMQEMFPVEKLKLGNIFTSLACWVSVITTA